MNTERIAEIQKIRNCVPFIDNGAGVPETQAAIDELLAENASLKAEAERNQWALNALVALEAAVRESVIRPTKDTEINTTNALLTLAGDNRQLRSELARLKEAALAMAKYIAADDACASHPKEDRLYYERAAVRLAVDANPTAAAAVRDAKERGQ